MLFVNTAFKDDDFKEYIFKGTTSTTSSKQNKRRFAVCFVVRAVQRNTHPESHPILLQLGAIYRWKESVKIGLFFCFTFGRQKWSNSSLSA